MNPELPIDPVIRRRNRIVLLALVLVFVLPAASALVLHLLQWKPAHYSNHGVLLQPARKLADLPLHRADGSTYTWAPQEQRWQVAVLPPPDCGTVCVDLIAGLDKVWQLQGRRADRLHVLWFGELPAQAAAFRTLVPMQPDPVVLERFPDRATSAAPALYLIDPFGFLVMQYPSGVDPADLRADLGKLLK